MTTTLCLVTNGITFGDIMLYFFIGFAVVCMIALVIIGFVNYLRTVAKPKLDTASQRKLAELEQAVSAISSVASQEHIAQQAK